MTEQVIYTWSGRDWTYKMMRSYQLPRIKNLSAPLPIAQSNKSNGAMATNGVYPPPASPSNILFISHGCSPFVVFTRCYSNISYCRTYATFLIIIFCGFIFLVFVLVCFLQ